MGSMRTAVHTAQPMIASNPRILSLSLQSVFMYEGIIGPLEITSNQPWQKSSQNSVCYGIAEYAIITRKEHFSWQNMLGRTQ